MKKISQIEKEAVSETAQKIENGVENIVTATPTKSRKITPMWNVLTRARNVFKTCESKNGECKLFSINYSLKDAATQDIKKFWADFYEPVLKLLINQRYISECKEYKCDPVSLAESITFLGSWAVTGVLRYGFSYAIAWEFELYPERFTPEIANPFREKAIAFFTLQNDYRNESITLTNNSIND